MDELIDAAEVARVLGVSQKRVLALAASAPGFPPPKPETNLRRSLWSRRSILTWAVQNPNRGKLWQKPPLPRPGELPHPTRQIVDLATKQTQALKHACVGVGHLLLGLLDPACPGAARAVLETVGVDRRQVRDAMRASANSSHTAGSDPQLSAVTHIVLERTLVEAIQLRDEQISSEHVLLALTTTPTHGPVQSLLTGRGVEPDVVRDCILALADGAAAHHDNVSEDQRMATITVDAADVARILGVSRRHVVELAASDPSFPASELSSVSRVWPRRAVEVWAAARAANELPQHRSQAPAREVVAPRSGEILKAAAAFAREANHDVVNSDHLLLTLLSDGCPGVEARLALQALGITLDQARRTLAESLGDPFARVDRSPTVNAATQHVLERAYLWSVELEDELVMSEHVLLALTDDWEGSHLSWLFSQQGIDAETVRRSLAAVTDGITAVASSLPPKPRWRRQTSPPPPEPDLVPSPAGHDPRQRRPWGSLVLEDVSGRPITDGNRLAQYFVDRDGYPVLTKDRQLVTALCDEQGQPVIDPDGKGILTPVNMPPEARPLPHVDISP